MYPDLQGYYDHFNDPVPAGITDEDYESLYLASKLWRLNNIYTVIDKSGEPVIFRMNISQHKVYAASRKHPRVIILKSRQQGISTFWLVSYFDDAVFCPYLNLGLMAQGTDEATTLLERAKFLWDNLNDGIKAFANVRLVTDNTKEFAFSNNSTIFIRVSFRSATLQRLHISELGKIANNNPKRAKETKSGTLQALGKGNTGVIESTAEGRNMFKSMWDSSVLALASGTMAYKDFYPVFLSWLDDPDCVSDVAQAVDHKAAAYFLELEEKTGRTLTAEQKNFWVIQYRELEGDVYQEYPGTPDEAFTAARDGTYYSKLFTTKCVRANHVINGLHDRNLFTDVYFDLGVDDYFVMIFVQWYRGEYRIIDEYWNNGYDMSHYIDVAFSRGYDIRDLIFPHDVKVRELSSGGGGGNSKAKSRLVMVREYMKKERLVAGTRVLPKTGVADGIEAVRRMIPMMWIDAKCTYLIDCLHNYSKEWDEKLQVWKLTPLHDEYSHGADALRQVAMGTRENTHINGNPDERRRTPTRTRGHAV